VEMPREPIEPVVRQDAAQRRTNVVVVEQRPQLSQSSEVLPDQLVNKTPVAQLQHGMRRISSTHRLAQSGSHIICRGRRADLVPVVLAVEQMLVHPRTAVLEQLPALDGQLITE